jgi:hypothetical protein
MLPLEPAAMATIYLNRDIGSSNGFPHDEIFSIQENDALGATVFQPYGVLESMDA